MSTDYEALAALAEAATPGPWSFEGSEDEWEMWTEPLDADGFYVHIVEDDPDYPPLTVADGRFIAAARTAVPDLLRAVERVRALHYLSSGRSEPTCNQCVDTYDWSYPCATIRALDGAS